MITIIHKLDILKNNYKPGEFLPIYSGGELLNRSAYYRYKARCVFVKRTLV